MGKSGLLLTRSSDISKNAYPNWGRTNYPGDEFGNYAERFKRSADILLDQIGENRFKEADQVIMPALFLYRHSLELILKSLYVTHSLTVRSTDIEKLQQKLNDHGLESLWDKCGECFQENVGRGQKAKDHLKRLRQAVLEFHQLDRYSDVFRYPYNTQLDRQGAGDKAWEYGIDFAHLRAEFEKMYNTLSGILCDTLERYHQQDSQRVFSE
ncbi:MAG: hypothetical protein KGZ64_11035 [Thermaerobacter sp.]|nr:hypothetical protein [Thermaerobacter sp.]